MIYTAKAKELEEDMSGKRDDLKYYEEHHQITETGIGVAKLHIKQGDYVEALKALDKCCDDLDKITISYRPATAKWRGL